jgi:hypothetical protein
MATVPGGEERKESGRQKGLLGPQFSLARTRWFGYKRLLSEGLNPRRTAGVGSKQRIFTRYREV